ncbi:hypothetical protein DP939_11260 [Spongiactinospora rosea]|uniref:DUF2567 domain-containing protein n=1 Tax=Spongiactinospora rosea TaxID=2248750 RepID=A0A366M4J6_9ACTN|nr:hypothetical protein [Spongiactinospora rosea]RBQ20362.1 hypothetical protein DP939_11260 [Spongiactinospora rosea]
MRESRDFAVTVLVLAVLGVAAGVVWSLVAPRAPYVALDGGPALADPSTQALVAADGWFAVITGAVGLAVGLVGFVLSRGRSPAVLAGLAGGGLVAAFLARWIGGVVNLGTAHVAAPVAGGPAVPGALELTASGVLVTCPLLAVGLYGLLLGLGLYRDDDPVPSPPPL